MILQKEYTAEDYFHFTEKLQDARFELVNGQIIPLYANEPLEALLVDYVLSKDFEEKQITTIFERATKKHDILVSNLHGLFFIFCKGKPYRVYSQNTAIKISWNDSVRIPDLMVIEKQLEARNKLHQVLNPILMIEVLSKSTQAKDKSEKLEEYQSMDSLQEYVMISQFEPKATIYRKLNENKWEQQIIKGLDKQLLLQTLNLEMAMEEIYAEINWENE